MLQHDMLATTCSVYGWCSNDVLVLFHYYVMIDSGCLPILCWRIKMTMYWNVTSHRRR